MLNDLLSFTAYSCKDGLILPCHYGIVFPVPNKVFLEFIPRAATPSSFPFSIPVGNVRYAEVGAETDVEEIENEHQGRYAMMTVATRGQFG